jgi:hypothetical protein
VKASVIQEAIEVSRYGTVEGTLIVETPCEDFTAFAALPRAIEFNGKVCVRTGWSSDTGRACYKSGVPFAKAVA